MAYSSVMSTGATVRAIRAAVFAVLALSVSAGGHILITGAPLPVVTTCWAGLAVFLVALLLCGDERSYLQIATALVPLELMLNGAFNLGQQACGQGTHQLYAVGGLPDLLLCGNGPARGMTVGSAPLEALHLSVPVHPTAGQFLLLLAAHVLAALLAAVWLRRGESAVFRTLRAVGAYAAAPLRVLLALLVLPVAVPGTVVPPAPRRSHPGPQDVLLRTVLRRGPPLLSHVG
jgi:hypothetical protein